MSATEMLSDLTRRGVRLQVVGDRLRLDAPPGVLNSDEINALATAKAEILAALANGGPEEANDAGSRWPPLQADADAFDRDVRASYAPILHLPPAGCVGRHACSLLGPCERHATGASCLVTTTQESSPCQKS